MKYQKLFTYIFIFVSAVIISGILFCFGRTHTDVDSARYMISALIQSEAAILAIVVTLSLVAVQQTSSSYSARVINIFKSNLDFLILMITYISAIIYGSWVLKQIPHSNYNLSLERDIWIVYSLSIFALFALWLYIVNILEMFKPTKIIELLSKNMSFSKINNAIKLENDNNIDENGQIQPINDSIQPIVDVLQGSIMKYDYETTRYGLKIIEQKTYDILKDKKCDDNYKPEIASRIIGHVETVGVVAVNKQMGKTVKHVASILGQFGTFMITDVVNYILSDLISSLKKIGVIAAKQEMEDATNTIISSLKDVAKTAIDNKLEDDTQKAITSIKEIGVIAAKQEMEDATNTIISSLKDVAKTAIDNKLEDDTRKVMTSIKEIGLSNIKYDHISYFVLSSVRESLEDIITKVAKKWGKEWEKDIWHGIFALQRIGFKLIEDENVADSDKLSLESQIMGAIFSISEITIDLELKRATYYAYMSVKNIGIRAANDNIDIAKEARNTFNDIYFNAIEKYQCMEDESSIKFIQQIEDNIKELDSTIESKQRNMPPE